jgi:CBS domain-containing protein
MTHDVELVSPDASLAQAAAAMRKLNVGFMPVVEDNRVVGALTDRDITIRCVADGQDPTKTKVRDCMTDDVITVHEDTDVHEAAEVMESQQIRRLIVVDDENRCIGVVSLGDLAVDTSDDRLVGEVLREVSQPVRSR